MNKINPITYFPNPDDGRPVSLGSLYIGVADTDPEVVGNQKTVYALQENGSQVAISQPISLSVGGTPVYNGDHVTLFVEGDYSVKVLDSSDSQAFYIPSNVSSPGDPSTDDFDDKVENGSFPMDSTASGNPSGTDGHLFVQSYGTDRVSQIFHDENGDIWSRIIFSDGGPWTTFIKSYSTQDTELYKKDNILGTVSQSGGVPTGAIIEAGSNANGEYVKFADGTLICHRTLASSSSADVTWTFPAVFTVNIRVYGTHQGTSTANYNCSCANVTTTNVVFSLYNASTGARVTASTALLAIGSWF